MCSCVASRKIQSYLYALGYLSTEEEYQQLIHLRESNVVSLEDAALPSKCQSILGRGYVLPTHGGFCDSCRTELQKSYTLADQIRECSRINKYY